MIQLSGFSYVSSQEILDFLFSTFNSFSHSSCFDWTLCMLLLLWFQQILFVAAVLSINIFLIYFYLYFFLPVSICVFTPFLFFLSSLLRCSSNICLPEQFPVSVLWAEPLNICTLLHLGQGKEFDLLLRPHQL